MTTLLSNLRRLVLACVVTTLLLGGAGASVDPASVEADLESGLAYLVAGNNVAAAWYLARFGERQGDPEIRRQVNVMIGRLDQLTTAASREQAARELKSFALDWRNRNFPVFP